MKKALISIFLISAILVFGCAQEKSEFKPSATPTKVPETPEKTTTDKNVSVEDEQNKEVQVGIEDIEQEMNEISEIEKMANELDSLDFQL